MYKLSRRAKVSLIIPLLVAVIYTASTLIHMSAADAISTPLILIGIMLIQCLTAYIVSVIFFSFETVTKLLVQGINLPVVIKRFQSRKLLDNLITIENYDTKAHSKITYSVLFQSVIVAISFYAAIASSNIIGKILVLSISLQMLVEQIDQLLKHGDIQEWFWQIEQRVTTDMQKTYVMVVSLLTIISIYLTVGPLI